MRFILGVAAGFLFLCCESEAQSPQVRSEAVQLLERADGASLSPQLPNLERTDVFRVYGSSGVQEGRFKRAVIQGTGRREETTFGDYHTIDVFESQRVGDREKFGISAGRSRHRNEDYAGISSAVRGR